MDQPLRTSARPSPGLPSHGALDHSFFWPKSIAFVGASPDHDTIRGKLLMFAVKNGFKGELYPVNPSHSEVDGYKSYPKVSAIGANENSPSPPKGHWLMK